MIVIIVPYEVASIVADITLVRHEMWLVYWTADSRDHLSKQKVIPKGYATAFKMCTPRLVTKLEGENGYVQVRANQDIVGLLLLICGIRCEYNSGIQDTYAMMQAKKCVALL